MQRKFYLDNMRWIIVLSVIPFHVFFIGNSTGLSGVMPGMKNYPVMDLIALLLFNPWIMPLICLIAGVTAKYSLDKRSEKQFFKNRVDKLLVPGTLGVLMWQWITALISTYANDPQTLYNNTGPVATIIKYVLFAVYGVGPLWVAQVLFLCCCILLLIKKIDKNDKLYKLCGKINLPILLSMFIIIWILAISLNVNANFRAFYIYKIGTCLAMFLIGYYILSHEKTQNLVKKWSILLSCIAGISTIILIVFVCANVDTLDLGYTNNIFVIWYIWIVSLAIFGFSEKHLNKQNNFTKYMSKISYGMLIVHYPILMLLCVIIAPLELPIYATHILLIISTYIFSFIAYQIFSRIPIIRYCMFGFRKKTSNAKTVDDKTVNAEATRIIDLELQHSSR